jgi:anti-sigma-K factor RskA
MTVKTEERHAQLELCIPYVFGRLNPGNRKQFEAHLTTGCEQCSGELSGLYGAIALMPLLLRQEAPPSGVRQRVLSRISSKKPDQPRSERPTPQREKIAPPAAQPGHSWYLYATIVLGILLNIALAIWVNQLVATTASGSVQIADLTRDLRKKQEVLDFLKAQRIEILPLAGVDAGSGAYGKLLLDPDKRSALVQTTSLPAQSEGKQYQLWALKQKKYFSVGVFDVTSEKVNIVRVMALPAGEKQDIEGFAVTLEPKGGSVQPTGPVQLRGVTK